MPCFHPTPARQDKKGKRVILHPPVGKENMLLPCGTCVGCRRRRASEWSHRAMHEARASEFNSFVTLTYDDDHLPEGSDLRPLDLRNFLRRVRRGVRARMPDRLPALLGSHLRFLACGEYGEAGGRPHYHALLFGVGFADPVRLGTDLYTSETLSDLWGMGHAAFGAVTPASAAYVATYSLKSTSRAVWSEHHDGVVKQPPFLRCSIRPGIGAPWLQKYKEDTRRGYIVVDGQQVAVPRYYQKLLEITDVGLHAAGRKAAAERARLVDASPEQLQAQEKHVQRLHELKNPRKFKL